MNIDWKLNWNHLRAEKNWKHASKNQSIQQLYISFRICFPNWSLTWKTPHKSIQLLTLVGIFKTLSVHCGKIWAFYLKASTQNANIKKARMNSFFKGSEFLNGTLSNYTNLLMRDNLPLISKKHCTGSRHWKSLLSCTGPQERLKFW